jgi:long-chain fatty acid transport protein
MVRSIKILFALFLMALAFPASVWATNGYFTHGSSIAEKGRAGTGVAYSQDTLAASNNPAGMVWQGRRYDVGAALFSPDRSYSSKGGPSAPVGTVCGMNCPFSIGDGDQDKDSNNDIFLIPQFGYNWMVNEDNSIGVSVFGNGGMNTEYHGGVALLGPAGTQIELPGTYGDGTAGVDLTQLFIAPTYAVKVTPTTSLGISAIIVYQRFEAKGLGNFAGYSTDPENLTNNGHDDSTGFGVRLGVQSEVYEGVRLGAAYQPKINMSEFDDYSGLFADNGDFDIPANWTVGLAIDIGESGTFFLDYQEIKYSGVDAVSNPIGNLVPSNGNCSPGMTGGTGKGCLGGSDGAGFGWNDMQIIKLGYQFQTGENMTWRLGYSKTDQPIPKGQVTFNILAPGVIEEHYTVGFTRKIDPKSSFNFAAMYAPSNSVKGKNTFDPAQDIKLEMDQFELAFSYSRRIE